MIRKITLALAFTTILINHVEANEDSLSFYESSLSELNNGRDALYKYGSFQPRNMKEAFLVFLTGDSNNLEKFKTMDKKSAIECALQRENNIFRYDWGQEGFFHFSQYCIDNYKMYAPEIQNQLALRSFHNWMNEIQFDERQLASKVKRGNNKMNREWKKRYRNTSKYLSRAYDRIWKEDKKARKSERKSSHQHLERR